MTAGTAEPLGTSPSILRLTLACGLADLAYALIVSALKGNKPGEVLRGILSFPMGPMAMDWGIAGALLGLVLHFALMAVMVALGLAILSRPAIRQLTWWKTGMLYGLVLYIAMYGLLIPARFGAPFPNPDKLVLAIWLVPHILFVGWPVALAAQGRLPGWFSRTG